MTGARVLLISNNFPPVTGGSVTVYENLCRYGDGAIVALAPSHDYMTGKPFDGCEARDRDAGYPIHRIELLRPVHPQAAGGRKSSKLADLALMARVLLRILRVARAERINVICLGDLIYGGWLAYPLRRLFGFKVVFYVHGEEITTQDGGGLFDAWRAKFLAQADAIIAVSRFTVEAMVDLMGVARDKITLVQNGVDLAKFYPRQPSPGAAARYGVAGRRMILTVGRLVPRKGMDRLVEAMALVRQAAPDAHLVVAGDGPLRPELEAAIDRLGLGEAVSLLGAVSDEALMDLYALCEVFAFPNRTMPDGDTEGFGLVFLEANAFGKPVVAGRAGGAVDAVTDGVNGLVVDGEEVPQIAAAILRLLDDRALYEALAEGGLAVASRSGWSSKTAEVLALCASLLRR